MSETKNKLNLMGLGVFLLGLAALIFVISLNNSKVRYLLLQAIKPFQPADEVIIKAAPIPKAVPRENLVELDKKELRFLDIDHLRNGLLVKKSSKVLPVQQGSPLANEARKSSEYYKINIDLTYEWPRPATKIEELEVGSPYLGEMLPWLETRLEMAKVSPYFEELYGLKSQRIRRNQKEWSRLLTMHHAYDTQTILEIPSEDLSQGMLLIQSEMDVVSDGTDGDRLPKMNKSITESQHYQPFTSYQWRKVTQNPNPLLPLWERKYKEETDAKRKDYYRRGVVDLKKRSFLVAEYDPFIVIPVAFLRHSGPWSPSVGDYAVVIYQDKLYPAIVGDAGPSYKMGEASLRIAREIDSRSSAYRRPVEKLEITYLVFTQSAKRPFGQPDYESWKEACSQLLTTMGGLGENYALESWKDLLAK